jgi:hypothetical protein
VRKGLCAHLQRWWPGGCEGAQERKEDAAMVAVERNELVNSNRPTIPLTKRPDEGTWAATWRKKRKR